MILLLLLLLGLVRGDPFEELRVAAGLTRREFLAPRMVQLLSSRSKDELPELANEKAVGIGPSVQEAWSAIKASPYSEDERRRHFPMMVNSVLWKNSMNNHNYIVRTSTTTPCAHAKQLHKYGAWAKVRWEPTSSTPYDGLWNERLTGLLRASRNGLLTTNTNPHFDAANRAQWDAISENSFADATAFRTKFSIALRLCRTTRLNECEDIVFLPRESVDWEQGNLFAQAQHTNVTLDAWTNSVFRQVSERPGEVDLSHVGKLSSPSSIRMVPSSALKDVWRPGYDWRESIARLPKHSKLYRVFDEHDDLIGTLMQESETWIASEVGDTRFTFHHHLDTKRSIDFRPVHAPPTIPLEWFQTPNLIYVIHAVILKEYPEMDTFFDIDMFSLVTDTQGSLNNVLFRLVMGFQPRYMQLVIPSRGSHLNYFINSTKEHNDFASKNRDTSNCNHVQELTIPIAPSSFYSSSVVGMFKKRQGFTTKPILSNAYELGALTNARVVNAPNTGLSSDETDRLPAKVRTLLKPILEVLVKHNKWFSKTFAKEKSFWRRINPNLRMLTAPLGEQAQLDPLTFRFGSEVDNDAWIDLEGRNRSCYVF